MNPTFAILLRDRPVATLHAEGDATSRTWVTDWDADWVSATPRPVVSLKLIDLRLNRPRSWGRRLPPFLTNILPEPDSALRRRVARTHEFDEGDDVAFLSLLGADLPGALRVLPVDARPAPPRLRPAVTDVTLSGYRASLGGMQLKFSAHRSDRITLPAHGELSEWILKLPSADLPRLPAWEAAALSWAAAAGFEVPEHHVEPVSRVDGLPEDVRRSAATCLVVRRFDRPGSDARVHMEEVCSVLGLHPEAKYAAEGQRYNMISVGNVVRRFAGLDDAVTLIERVVFDALAGNGDAHLKNWALIFPVGHAVRLAPVYDVVPTATILGDPDLALPLHGSRCPAFDQVRPHSIREFARRIDVDPNLAETRARALVGRATDAFDDVAASTDLSRGELSNWKAHIERVARLWR